MIILGIFIQKRRAFRFRLPFGPNHWHLNKWKFQSAHKKGRCCTRHRFGEMKFVLADLWRETNSCGNGTFQINSKKRKKWCWCYWASTSGLMESWTVDSFEKWLALLLLLTRWSKAINSLWSVFVITSGSGKFLPSSTSRVTTVQFSTIAIAEANQAIFILAWTTTPATLDKNFPNEHGGKDSRNWGWSRTLSLKNLSRFKVCNFFLSCCLYFIDGSYSKEQGYCLSLGYFESQVSQASSRAFDSQGRQWRSQWR